MSVIKEQKDENLQSLSELRQFIAVANASGFSAAAKTLNQTTATVSAAIKRLENTLGCRLFERSTRSVRLTEEGASFYDNCLCALRIIDSGVDELRSGHAELRGKIVLSAPTDLARSMLSRFLHEFLALNPFIDMEIRVSDSLSDLHAEPIDVAIRYGIPPDSSLIARLLNNAKRVACASPEYIASYGMPRNPSDLNEHRCLCYKLNQSLDDQWRFYKGRKEIKQTVSAHFSTDDSALAREWALAGKGIVYKSELDLADDIESGRLQNLFTGYTGSESPLYLVYPHAIHQSRRVKALVTFLLEKFNPSKVS